VAALNVLANSALNAAKEQHGIIVASANYGTMTPIRAYTIAAIAESVGKAVVLEKTSFIARLVFLDMSSVYSELTMQIDMWCLYVDVSGTLT
jgi:hypothetical protein